ncbi:MAG: PA0069 family radical SAM protein [Alphaproteobacteria bacterium]|nr:PA0069 family radical SAM protein [Alphaproteobacteria bacterium]
MMEQLAKEPARQPFKGRGAAMNPKARFDRLGLEPFDDGWESLSLALEEKGRPATEVSPDRSRSVIARNQSPDIPFEQSINPYRGCEHGCIYCYARPSHAFLGLSPGLDFETKLWAKYDAAEILVRELARPAYRCSPIALGANTDPYQPIERKLEITRKIVDVLARHDHPLTIVTKSAAVLRDLDLLAPMAEKGLVSVAVSITTLDPALARKMEPRAAAPHRRLDAIRELAAANIPTVVMAAPIIPGLTDHETEAILAAAAERGAWWATYTLLRMPHEIKELFRNWLLHHEPLRADRVISLHRQCRGGRLNDLRFGHRMRGEGAYAELIGRRFQLARRRLGLERKIGELRSDLFKRPGDQLRLL